MEAGNDRYNESSACDSGTFWIGHIPGYHDHEGGRRPVVVVRVVDVVRVELEVLVVEVEVRGVVEVAVGIGSLVASTHQ